MAAEAAAFRMPFSHLALLAQVPGVDLDEAAVVEKGGRLDGREQAILAERRHAAIAWLETYAPESAVIRVREEPPDEIGRLGDDQRVYLGALALASEAAPPRGGEGWQALIFETAKTGALPAGRAFGALYVAFLGRTNGPRAGWLLASLDPAFVDARLREAAGWGVAIEGGVA